MHTLWQSCRSELLLTVSKFSTKCSVVCLSESEQWLIRGPKTFFKDLFCAFKTGKKKEKRISFFDKGLLLKNFLYFLLCYIRYKGTFFVPMASNSFRTDCNKYLVRSMRKASITSLFYYFSRISI